MNTIYKEEVITMPRTTMTLRVDPQILSTLDMLAKSQRRTRSSLASIMIEDRVLSEVKIMQDLQEGVDQLNRGERYTHENTKKYFDAVIEKAYKK